MDIAVRVDASPRLGAGHMARCLALASDFRRDGAQVRFLSAQLPDAFATRIQDSGFRLLELPGEVPDQGSAGSAESSRSASSQASDAEASLRAIRSSGVDLLIVDHYGLDAAWESRVAACCGSLLVIDDLAKRPHLADVLVDHNLRSPGSDPYQALVPESARVLQGPSYGLIRSEYRCARHEGRPLDAGRARVLVSLGGGEDDLRLIGAIITGLSRLPGLLSEVELVVADPGRTIEALPTEADGLPLKVHGPQPHLAALMGRAHLAIGSGGGTTLERLCVGVHLIVVIRAENQLSGMFELERMGALLNLGRAEQLGATQVRGAVEALLRSPAERVEMRRIGQDLVDGYGCQRVVESVIPTPASQLSLREAIRSDRGLLWRWANENSVREQSLSIAPISWPSHVAWFDRVVDDPNTRLLILEVPGLPVGQIRYDIDGEIATINYSLDACARGRGWGTLLVELGLRWLRKRDQLAPVTLVALVRIANVSSAKVFERPGFVCESATHGDGDVLRFTRSLHE